MFVTQDGAYHFRRMPWGLKGAPLYFQYAVWTAMAPGRETWIVIYVDDMVIKGRSLEEVWSRTLEVVRQLSKAGFKVNLNKTTVLTPSIEMVGYNLCCELYYAGDKAVRKLL